MIKFFLIGIISVFFVFFLVQNSFTAFNNSSPQYNPQKTDSKVSTIKDQHQQIEETSSNKTSTTPDKKNKDYLQGENAKKANSKFDEDNKFSPKPPDITGKDKDILENIKSPHGEVIIKKIKIEKNVTTLVTEDKRTTGLQMPTTQKPAAGEIYLDNKNSKAETGIQLTKDNQQPVATENYSTDNTSDHRY